MLLSKLCATKMQINIKNYFSLKIRFVYTSATYFIETLRLVLLYRDPTLRNKKKNEQGTGCYSGFKLLSTYPNSAEFTFS